MVNRKSAKKRLKMKQVGLIPPEKKEKLEKSTTSIISGKRKREKLILSKIATKHTNFIQKPIDYTTELIAKHFSKKLAQKTILIL